MANPQAHDEHRARDERCGRRAVTEFAEKYGPWALIAGASEGIGASLADQLATRGLDLVLIARNGALLEELSAGVRERHGVEARPLVQDLTAPDAGDRVAEATVTRGLYP